MNEDKIQKNDVDVVASTGRGVVFIAFGKIWFMLTGWALLFSLPRIFEFASGDGEGGQSLFGSYKLVIMGVSFINNSIIAGTIQTVSKFTSEDVSQAGAVRRTGLRIQGLLGLAVALLYIGFAGVVADALGSPDLAFLMRLSAGIIVSYSCYAVFIGSFNGRRLYGRQALIDIGYATVKTTLIAILAAVGFEVLGAVLGFFIAATLFATVAWVVTGSGEPGLFPARRYLSFAVLLIVYTFILNLVLSLDLFLLKGLSAKSAAAAGMSALEASEISKQLAGKYGAAQALGFIPYQAVLAIALVVFPMISKATFDKDEQKTRAYIRNTLRFTAIFIVGIAGVFASIPEQAVSLVFPENYFEAAGPLRLIALAIIAFGLMMISNVILNSAGMVYRTLGSILITLVVLVAAVVFSLRGVSADVAALEATARGTLIGMVFGMVLSGYLVYRQFKTFWPWWTAAKALFALVAVMALGTVLPDGSKLLTLVEAISVFVVYLGLLALMREFGAEDISRLKRIFGKAR